MYAVDKQGRQIQAKMSISLVVRIREMSLLSESNPFLSSLWNFHHHHHKHQGLNPLIRSVSRVTTALAKVSSVFKLFFFLLVCSDCGILFWVFVSFECCVFFHKFEGCNGYHCSQWTIFPTLGRLHLKLPTSENYRQREILIRHGARLDALHCIAFGLPPANKSSLQSCKASLHPPLPPPTTSSHPPLLSSGLGNKWLWDSICNNVTSHPAWPQRSYHSGPGTTSQVF